MNDLNLLFAGALAAAAVLAAIAIYAPKRLGLKVMALAAMTLFAASAYAAMTELMGRPKPLALEWTPPALEETTVVAAQMEENVAIYLWVLLQESPEPQAYVLPWDEETARELHEAQRAAEAEGGTVQVRLTPQQTNDVEQTERMFYAAPPSAPPPKIVAEAGESTFAFRSIEPDSY